LVIVARFLHDQACLIASSAPPTGDVNGHILQPVLLLPSQWVRAATSHVKLATTGFTYSAINIFLHQRQAANTANILRLIMRLFFWVYDDSWQPNLLAQ
jgi:hypothetical protein